MVTTLSIHADLDIVILQNSYPCFAGELSTLIGIKYLRITMVLNGSLQNQNAEIGIRQLRLDHDREASHDLNRLLSFPAIELCGMYPITCCQMGNDFISPYRTARATSALNSLEYCVHFLLMIMILYSVHDRA